MERARIGHKLGEQLCPLQLPVNVQRHALRHAPNRNSGDRLSLLTFSIRMNALAGRKIDVSGFSAREGISFVRMSSHEEDDSFGDHASSKKEEGGVRLHVIRELEDPALVAVRAWTSMECCAGEHSER